MVPKLVAGGVLATLIPLIAASSAAVSPGSGEMPATSLHEMSGRLRIGSAVSLPQLSTDPAYRDVLAREFDSVTPENAMKWESVEPVRGSYRWDPADEIVAFAAQHGQAVRGHTLVWHNQLPGWLNATATDLSDGELRDVLRQHILDEAGYFRGRVDGWDVVNEAVGDDASGSLRSTIWLEKLGPGYIADALRWAHEADPDAKLYLNDYNIEAIGPKSDAYYNLARQLLADGVPLDGLGIQGHLGLQYGFPDTLPQNIKRFVDLGLEVAITELDVRMVLPADDAKLATQADYYRRVVESCLANTGCVGVTVWGFGDRDSWVPGFFPGEGAACLFDEQFVPKPAYAAVLDALQQGPSASAGPISPT